MINFSVSFRLLSCVLYFTVMPQSPLCVSVCVWTGFHLSHVVNPEHTFLGLMSKIDATKIFWRVLQFGFIVQQFAPVCAQRSANFHQGLNFNQKWSGIQIWISRLTRMSAILLPKCCGFILFSASVISPCIVNNWLVTMRIADEFKDPYSAVVRGGGKVIRNLYLGLDHHQKLINSSIWWVQSLHWVSLKLADYFFSNSTRRQWLADNTNHIASLVKVNITNNRLNVGWEIHVFLQSLHFYSTSLWLFWLGLLKLHLSG